MCTLRIFCASWLAAHATGNEAALAAIEIAAGGTKTDADDDADESRMRMAPNSLLRPVLRHHLDSINHFSAAHPSPSRLARDPPSLKSYLSHLTRGHHSLGPYSENDKRAVTTDLRRTTQSNAASTLETHCVPA